MEQAVVARQRARYAAAPTAPSRAPAAPAAADGRVLGAQVKYVQRRGEEERELQRRADGLERVGGRVVRGEDGDVEGVVLSSVEEGVSLWVGVDSPFLARMGGGGEGSFCGSLHSGL